MYAHRASFFFNNFSFFKFKKLQMSFIWSSRELNYPFASKFSSKTKNVPFHRRPPAKCCTLIKHYRVFLLRNYRLIVAPRKFDALKTNIYQRSEASRANILVLRTSNFQGTTIRPIVLRHKHALLSLVFTTKFSFTH